MEIRRSDGEVGAEILGVDVRSLAASDFERIYQTWLERNVIAVRDQSLTLEQFVTYSRRFGRIYPHPSKSTRHPERPEVTLLGVNKFDEHGKLIEAVYRRGGEGWHTDGAYDEIPFKATQLYAVAIPSQGGDTLFASMYAAFDALPSELRIVLRDRLGGFTYGGRSRSADALLNAEDRAWTPVYHPLFRIHPETGRTALYFDPGKIVSISGLPEDESNDIIDKLTGHMIQPDAQYRHQWRVGDIVIWDNRCSYHKAAADYPPSEDRIHWRVSIKPNTA
ncbi:MAG: TauD/TfdA family dioxygenase [Pseudomonadota bacterium]